MNSRAPTTTNPSKKRRANFDLRVIDSLPCFETSSSVRLSMILWWEAAARGDGGHPARLNWHNCSTVFSISPVPTHALGRIQRVQAITIAWMSVEAAVSLFAAIAKKGSQLPAFGE